MLASQKRGTLYIGVTSHLEKRVQEHKEKIHEGFTKQYNVTTLVWYDVFETMQDALQVEKKLKDIRETGKYIL
jgi:putative endonuclease